MSWNGTIENPGKIGLGTWESDNLGTTLRSVEKLDLGWYYNWRSDPLWAPDPEEPRNVQFVPMIWDERKVTSNFLTEAKNSSSDWLLTFNEPNLTDQADMTVEQAVALWPELMKTGKLLGSPAATESQTLGESSWLGRFMDQIDAKGDRVDFIAVHYYSTDGNVADFQAFLNEVKLEYNLPIWVTEWSLVDWYGGSKFTQAEIAAFAHDAALMLDDLSFVKRHAWYGDDDTELFTSNGGLTTVGKAFAALTSGTELATGTDGDDIIVPGQGGVNVVGGMGSDTVSYAHSERGMIIDLASQKATNGVVTDTLSSIENAIGSAHNDQILGNSGANVLDGGRRGADKISGSGGSDTVSYASSERGVTIDLASKKTWDGLVKDTLSSMENVIGSAHNDQILGNSGANVLDGGAGADQLRGGAGADTFVFRNGEAQGDSVADFNGNGAGAGDTLRFEGFGPSATSTQADSTHWIITDGASTETITFASATGIHSTDYFFA